MSLTVCTSAQNTEGCGVKTAKALLGIAGASDDTLLGILAVRAVEAIESYLGYPVRLQSYSESVAGYGSRTLMLSRTPIRTVFRVLNGTDSGTATVLTASEYHVEDAEAGLVSRDSGFIWTAPIATHFVDYQQPGQETTPWLIDYAAGYRLVGSTSTAYGVTSTGADVPGDVAQAIDETIKGWYLARAQDANVASVSVGSLAMTFRDQTAFRAVGALPVSAERLLSRHRRLA
jgi:uncharacterized phiE125 gp8 family phage protein